MQFLFCKRVGWSWKVIQKLWSASYLLSRSFLMIIVAAKSKLSKKVKFEETVEPGWGDHYL